MGLLYEGIMQLASNMNRFDNKFDTSRTCAVCGRSGHAFDNCDALKDADKIKQAYIKMCVACSKFRAALDRIRPGDPNQDLNLVRMTPIDQLHTLTSIPDAPLSTSALSSLQSDVQSL